jgi:hypothetical protein
MTRPGTLVPLTLAWVLLLATGCSSLPLPMTSSDDPSEVAGTYQIRQFEFEPKASSLKTIDVLEYVENGASSLELTSSQDFILKYRIRDGKQVTLTGTYSLSSNKVELAGQREDARRYQKILLDRRFYLHRQKPNVLWVHTKKQVSAEQLSASYDGLTGVEGTLRLELVRDRPSAVSDR